MVFFRMPAPADTPTDDLSPEALEYIKTLTKLHARFTVLSERTPVNRKAYVFIGRGGGGLSGNAKYLFLHMARKHPEVESWFLTESLDDYKALRQANLPVLFYPDEVTIHKLAEAGTVVVESISFRRALYMPLLAKARQVQLWHGVGNKKIGFQLANVPVLEGRTDNLVADHSDYDIIVTTSPFYTEEVFKKSMDAKEFLDYGYPRTDIFRSRVNADALLGCDTAAYAAVRAARKKGWKVLLYAPTFRDTEITPLTLDAFNLLDFFDLLKKHRIHLILKPHPRVPMKAPGLPEWVTLCRSDSDIYPFFPLVDILLTDYSSIHTEFLLLDRPVIFFWADFQSYNIVDRGLQFPVEDMSPGPKCFDGPSLFRAIVDAARGKDEWGPARRALRDKAFSHQDGKACERIAARLLQGEFAPETGKPPAPPAGTPSEHA